LRSHPTDPHAFSFSHAQLSLLGRLLLYLSLLCGFAAPVAALAQEPLTSFGVAANKVKNWSFETFEGPRVDQKVAVDWDAFVLSGNPQFRSGYSRFGANVERIDGKDSQVLISKDPFDAGVYQIVSHLQANQWYSVLVYVLSVFQTSAVDDPSVFDGLIVKQIGVDPEGGRNPTSTSIIWGPPMDKNMHRETWGQRLIFQATGTTATLFIRVRCLQGVSLSSYDNVAFIDGAQMRLAPISQAIVPEDTPSGAFTVGWKSVVPNAYSTEARVVEYDVQYRDGNGPWQDWLSHTAATSASFDLSSPGHTYTFRVRGWARYYNPFAEIFGPWAESAPVQIGHVIEVTVLDNRDRRVLGVPVCLLDSNDGVVASAVTDASGVAYLAPGDEGQYSVAISPSWYQAPAPIHGVTAGPGVRPVALTARPPDDAVSDGSFEAAELGAVPPQWKVVGSTVQTSDFLYHGGRRSVVLATNPQVPEACIRQTFSPDAVYQPALSTWYKLLPGQEGMSKELLALLVDEESNILDSVSLQSQTESDWQHLSLVATGEETPFTGSITVELCLQDPPGSTAPFTETVYAYLDDISFGRSSGGPFKVFLPATFQSGPQ